MKYYLPTQHVDHLEVENVAEYPILDTTQIELQIHLTENDLLAEARERV